MQLEAFRELVPCPIPQPEPSLTHTLTLALRYLRLLLFKIPVFRVPIFLPLIFLPQIRFFLFVPLCASLRPFLFSEFAFSIRISDFFP